MAAQVAQPADAQPAAIAFQRRDEFARVVAPARQGQARIEARLHRQQQRQVGHIARHRAANAELLEEHFFGGAVRHAARRGAQPIHVVEGRRRTQRPHHVGPVGHRQHAQRHRHARAAAAAAGRTDRVEGIARNAVDRVVGMAAQAELGAVGAPDEQRPAGPHPFVHDGVGLRDLPRVNGRALGGDHTARRRDVFGRLREPVQRPQPGAARQLRVEFAGLRPQGVAVLHGHDRVDRGIEAVDLRQAGLQDFHARYLARLDRRGQCHGIQADDVRRLAGSNGSSHGGPARSSKGPSIRAGRAPDCGWSRCRTSANGYLIKEPVRLLERPITQVAKRCDSCMLLFMDYAIAPVACAISRRTPRRRR